MPETRYWTQLATEQFSPGDLVVQAAEAEQAGFDALNASDHYQPWWEPGESGHAWVLLGAIGHVTGSIPIGTGVTAPVFRHNPAVVAQAFATLEEMNPGRAFLGIGSVGPRPPRRADPGGRAAGGHDRVPAERVGRGSPRCAAGLRRARAARPARHPRLGESLA